MRTLVASGLAGLRRRPPAVADHARFDPDAWERRRRHAVDRAFAEVLLYREQWAVAGHILDEPQPVRAAGLEDELYRLCPFARPWDPTREPSLWIGDPTHLRDALTLGQVSSPTVPDIPTPTARPRAPAGLAPVDRSDRPIRPVLEVRSALVDWDRLGWFGPPYAPVLGPDAPVADATRRRALNLPAWNLVLQHGGAVLVGPAADRPAVLAEAEAILGSLALEWLKVDRRTPGQAARSDDHVGHLVVHDPYLGYVAARVPSCGRLHVLWTDVHAQPSADGLLFTRLRTRRPTLVNVIPVDPGFDDITPCPDHGTPTLARRL